jgi:uncharacterized protein (DUF1499 family)
MHGIQKGVVFMLMAFTTSCSFAAPAGLGVKQGRLAPCPSSPNCVSTQSPDESHRMDPIPYQGSMGEARERVRGIVLAMPRTKIAGETDDYLHAEFRSLIWRFVDDVEFLFDDASKRIHFRSASRVGHSDLGVNRKRMETIRERFENIGP